MTEAPVCQGGSLLSRTLAVLQSLRQSWTLDPSPRQRTEADSEVPLIFRENYLLSGYRVPYKPWSYYVHSLLFLHNESGNVWSHLIGLLIFVYKIFELSPEVGNWTEPMSWPILGFIAGIVTYAVLSTLAHLFQSKSPLVHYLCFQIDYIGIGMNGYGTGCIVYYLTGTEAYYGLFPPHVFMALNALCAILVCFCCSMAKLRYSRPYPVQRKFWQLGSVGLHCLFGGLPYLCHLARCLTDPSRGFIFAEHSTEFQIVVFFGLSTFFYATAIPERLSPGTFDIIGHGHQIFHVLMIVTSLLQIRGGMIRTRTRSPELAALAVPSAWTIFGGIAVVVFVDVLFIVFTRGHRIRKVNGDARREGEVCRSEGASSVSNGHTKSQ